MKWSQTLIPTLREAPSDAEILSHKLLLRAGLIRKLAGGVYTFMPLGLRALRKVEQIIREEMDRAGAIEVLMPAGIASTHAGLDGAAASPRCAVSGQWVISSSSRRPSSRAPAPPRPARSGFRPHRSGRALRGSGST